MVTVIKRGTSRKRITELLRKLRKRAGLDARKYCGVLSLEEDPISIQRKLRDDWQ